MGLVATLATLPCGGQRQFYFFLQRDAYKLTNPRFTIFALIEENKFFRDRRKNCSRAKAVRD